MYAKINNGTVEQYPYTLQELYAEYPNTSFPTHMTPDLLAEFDVVIVVGTGAQEHDAITENAVEGAPTYVQERDRWEQTWNIVSASEEEIAQRQAVAKAGNAAYAKKLLEETDWSQLPDVGLTLTNKADFDTYRATVRQIVIDPPVTVESWPEKPAGIWS